MRHPSAAAACLATALAACVPGPASGDTDTDTDTDAEYLSLRLHDQDEADVLFVIDDSHSMGRPQNNLARSIGRFVDALDEVDLRIAITTTDNGNYWCNGVTSAEAGHFVLSSCRARLADFVSGDIDATRACTNSCALDQLPVQPTASEEDDVRVRPWLERIEGETNLGDGVTLTEALQCALPQGVDGCGFESHLESMWLALDRTMDPDDDEFGFARDNSPLAVVFVTDEVDCSFNPRHETTVFGEPGVGNQALWSLPEVQDAPTSAVCWNAGVSCNFDGAGTCRPIDRDEDGDPTFEQDAVLNPLSRYVDMLEATDPSYRLSTAQVFAIAGVPEDYPQTGYLPYDPGSNPDDPSGFVAQHGVGPGCSSDIARAVPPVRLRAFAETFLNREEDDNLFSVCSEDYGPALEAIGAAMKRNLRPACIPMCVADADPAPGLQPDCIATERFDDGRDPLPLPQCDEAGSLPSGSDACIVYRTGDAVEEACREVGDNAGYRVVRRHGNPGRTIQLTCRVEQDREAAGCAGFW